MKSLEEAQTHLHYLDGVMMGREAYQNPGLLAQVDRTLFGSGAPDADAVAVVRAMYPYIERELAQGTYRAITDTCWACSGHPVRVSGAAI